VIPELRPRSVGEVLDAAVRLYRARFRALLTVSVVVLVPVSILTMLVLLSAQPDQSTVAVNASNSPVFDAGDTSAQLGALIVTLLLSALATTFVTAAATRIVADAYVGQSTETRDAARDTWRRFWPLVGLTIVVTAGTFVGYMFCFIPGVWLHVAWAVAIPVLLLEGVGVFKSLGRSFALTKAKFWVSFGVVWMAQFLVLALSFGLSALFVWVTRTNDNASADVITQSVANAISSIFTVPFAATAIVALYFDLRIRAEGFDIQMMLRDLDHTAPEPMAVGPAGSSTGHEPGFAPR
jgi:hypothetical protein